MPQKIKTEEDIDYENYLEICTEDSPKTKSRVVYRKNRKKPLKTSKNANSN